MKWIFGLFLLSSPLASAGNQTVRVLCWNIHHGVGMDGKLDLPRIAKVIQEAKPDLVALQEVDKNCRRSGNVDQASELARLTGLHASFGKAMDFDGGEYGQAILCEKAPQHTKLHKLPGNGEPRIAFEAEISIAGIKLSFATAHLDLDAAARLSQTQTLIQALSLNTSHPLILCGDFNDHPKSPPIMALSKALTPIGKKEPALTCPADQPDSEIDHLFVRGLEPAGQILVLPEKTASDHRPLLTEIKLPLRN